MKEWKQAKLQIPSKEPAKKSERPKKLTLHKETLKHIVGGTHDPGTNTIPSQQGGPLDCDGTTDCPTYTVPPG